MNKIFKLMRVDDVIETDISNKKFKALREKTKNEDLYFRKIKEIINTVNALIDYLESKEND